MNILMYVQRTTNLQIHTHRRHTPQLGLTLLAGLNCFVVFLGLLFWGLSWQATVRVYKPPLILGTTENTQWKHLSRHSANIQQAF